MDGNTIRRDQRTLYKLKQISRLIIINPRPALIIECRPNVHLLLLRSPLPPLLLSLPARARDRIEKSSRGGQPREKERGIFARCVRDNAPPPPNVELSITSAELWTTSLFLPPISFVTKASGKEEGGGGYGLRVRRPIASSLTAINCQNVPHNSARANRGNLPPPCESIDFSNRLGIRKEDEIVWRGRKSQEGIGWMSNQGVKLNCVYLELNEHLSVRNCGLYSIGEKKDPNRRENSNVSMWYENFLVSLCLKLYNLLR